MDDNEKKFQKDLKQFVISTLRRASYRWPHRNEALKRARVDRGVYKCANCGGHFKKDQIAIDHIEPVVSVNSGWTNFDDFIRRLYVKTEEFQILCSHDGGCHDSKTRLEDAMRAHYNKKEKDYKKSLVKQEKSKYNKSRSKIHKESD